MKQENKKCARCGNFNAYYTMGFCCLLRENNGYCSRHERVVKKCDSCDEWRCRYPSRARRIKVAVKSIDEIYKKIAAIEQMLRYIDDEADNEDIYS